MIIWSELFKIRLASSIESMDKHEVVKLLLVRMLLRKHRKHKNFIRIYTEFPLGEEIKCDVYFENTRTKEAYAYEIQKNYSQKWLKDRVKRYKDWEVPFMRTSDWIPINLNNFSNDIEEMKEELSKYVY